VTVDDRQARQAIAEAWLKLQHVAADCPWTSIRRQLKR
jgi:hypothetical protein